MAKSSDKTPQNKKKASKGPAAAAAKTTTVKKASACTAKQLLGVIAQLGLLHEGKPPRDLVAKRAGYGNADNGSFKKALSRASTKGYVLLDNEDKTIVELTDEGRKEAGDPPKLESNEEVHNKIKEELSAKMVQAFELIKDGKPHQRSDIAPKLGYQSIKDQGFKKLLDRIKAKGYLDFVDKDFIQLSDLCFPNGRK